MKKNYILLTIFIGLFGFGLIQCTVIPNLSDSDVTVTENVQYKTNLNLIEILQRIFPTFYQLIQRAGLASKIESEPNLTIFAPTEEAFVNLKNFLGTETYNAITGAGTTDNPAHLTQLVSMHIVPTRILSHEIMHLESIRPLSGRKLYIHKIDGMYKINGSANAERFDIIGTNGVIHTIDAVLMP